MEQDESDQAAAPVSKESLNAAVAASTIEVVQRYGNAGAEYIKGYTGKDALTGQKFALGLKTIAGYKVPAEHAAKVLASQAGYAAEVAATSRDNAEAIINGSPVRTVRSDDHPSYKRNHNVVDRLQVLDGQVVMGSEGQMKFVAGKNCDALLNKIAKPDGDFARYRGIKLELPSEQMASAEATCRTEAAKLRTNAEAVDALGKPDVAARLREHADNYDQLAANLKDSGLTSEDALFYRTHPRIATLRDMAHTSHRAGVEGAKGGAVIGAAISLATSAFLVATERQQMSAAMTNVAMDTVKAGAMGYASASAGSTLTSVMQQSGHQGLQTLSRTAAPAMVVNVCITMGVSIKRYANGEIDGLEFMEEIGEKGSGMLAAGMMAALGQIAIPIPLVGAAIGGMIGCTLSSMFYRESMLAGRNATLAKEALDLAIELHEAAREEVQRQRTALADFMAAELPAMQRATAELVSALDATEAALEADAFAVAINSYATLLGARLEFSCVGEFECFMASDRPLRL
ncbi:hypothetical protein BCL79_2937 [Stenotrophomonas rhizophila]|uniref:Uncharacterized protein n=1 Tax=Stenotrophomonas rhizophila TaxID=216778 RepID=A0A498C6A1_9GAMM|nr:hypothetical protein [Stenotrophomonas rhizophila]RLK51794.1 hypothetical protein BCL79_2937 [Stenotrophomonas rhizophila]